MSAREIIDAKKCPYCGKEEWEHLPDSLADFCAGCGFVRVDEGNGTYSKGHSIQKWVNDVYGKGLPPIPDPHADPNYDLDRHMRWNREEDKQAWPKEGP